MNIKAIQEKQKEFINDHTEADIIKTELIKQGKNTHHNTTKKYNTVFNSFNNYTAASNIAEINQANIKKIYKGYADYLTIYKTKNNKPLSDNTINQYMILITRFLRDPEYCNLNINKNWYKRIKTKKPETNYITYAEYNYLIEYLDNIIDATSSTRKKTAYTIDRIMIKLLYCTGLRIHEALKIKIADILELQRDDEFNIYQYKVIGKGNKARSILISSALYDDLIEYIRQCTHTQQVYLFESPRTHKPFTAVRFEKNFKQIAKAIDDANNINYADSKSYTKNLKPHNLRHSYATRRIERGTKINVLQELLGHENITTTQIYTKINERNLRSAAAGTLD